VLVRIYPAKTAANARGRTPIQTLKDWQRQRPDLFKKRPHNHAGFDS